MHRPCARDEHEQSERHCGASPVPRQRQPTAGDLDVKDGDSHPEAEEIGLSEEAALDHGVQVVAVAGSRRSGQHVRGMLPAQPDGQQEERRPQQDEHPTTTEELAMHGARHSDREDRQRAVEDDLNGERPGGTDPDDHRRRPVVLQQQASLKERERIIEPAVHEARTEPHVRRPEHERDVEQDEPVRGRDAQEPVVQVRPDR